MRGLLGRVMEEIMEGVVDLLGDLSEEGGWRVWGDIGRGR